MTVGELMGILKAFPPTDPVLVFDPEFGIALPAESVYRGVHETGSNIDPTRTKPMAGVLIR